MRWGFVAGSLLAVAAAGWMAVRPSNDRDWAPDHARIPIATFGNDGTGATAPGTVTVQNVRAFRHCPEDGVPVERWETRTWDLGALDSVWLVLSTFERDRRGPAHPFLTFGFGDTAFVAVSVEARRERGESYSIWRGMRKGFEMAYVVAEERDPLTLRVLCRDDDIWIIPIRTNPERAARLFRAMLKRGNELARRPEFYHTLGNNCATATLDHVNDVVDERIPGGWRLILPGYSDEIALRAGLVDADADIEEIRRRFLVNERVREFGDRRGVSRAVREGL